MQLDHGQRYKVRDNDAVGDDYSFIGTFDHSEEDRDSNSNQPITLHFFKDIVLQSGHQEPGPRAVTASRYIITSVAGGRRRSRSRRRRGSRRVKRRGTRRHR